MSGHQQQPLPLIDTSPPPIVAAPNGPPEPWVNPDPAIAKVQAAYQAALAAAQPEPVRPQPTGSETSGRFAKRPGFA